MRVAPSQPKRAAHGIVWHMEVASGVNMRAAPSWRHAIRGIARHMEGIGGVIRPPRGWLRLPGAWLWDFSFSTLSLLSAWYCTMLCRCLLRVIHRYGMNCDCICDFRVVKWF